jgi:diguanylate cyclase (GGDEF)-like protein/PAS domain S-box-containing protein
MNSMPIPDTVLALGGTTGPAARTPLPWKLLTVAFIFITITAISVAMTLATIGVQSAVRSLVAGEGSWSKAQRDASFLLIRYGQTGEADYYRRFQQRLAVPLGDRTARLEMQKDTFSSAIATQGFLEGGNHPGDIPSVIWLYRCCSQFPQIRRVVGYWTKGDEHILLLQALAEQLKAEIDSSSPSEVRIQTLLKEVEAVNDSVHPLEAGFTKALGETARWVSSLLMIFTTSIVVLLVALGAYLSLRIVRSIRSSEEQYRTLMHSAADGLIVVDRVSGLVLEINQCAERMIGRPASELLGSSYDSLFKGPCVNLQPGFDQTGVQLSSLRTRAGDAMAVEVTCSATPWNGRPALLAILRDVSERIKTERLLRIATNAMANMTEAVVIVDQRFRVVSVNSAFASITGYSEAEVIGTVRGYVSFRAADTRKLRQIIRVLKREGRWQGELQNVRKNGESYPAKLSLASVPEKNGSIAHYVGIFNDNSAFRDYETRLKHFASHDMLTELPNRPAFEAAAAFAISRAKAGGGRLALLFIDLDGFKGVNDTYGHAAGDAVLQTLGKRIRRCLKKGDAVARVGGDEFNALLDQVGSEAEVAPLARVLLAMVGEPVEFEGQSIALSASIGISFYPQDATDVDALVSHADMAMYEAKSLGRNNFQVFSKRISLAVSTRLALVHGLRRAIEREQFELQYQPCTDLASGRIVGFEALLRWNHPELGLVPSCHFIPLAEEIGVIDAISDWVLRTACAQGMQLRARGMRDVSLAVNLSPRNFWDLELPNRIAGILQESGWPPALLCLEITEGTLMGREDAVEMFKQLGQLGIALAIDDFGIGYSSLGNLQRFPVDVLKIDRAFTHGIPENRHNLALVRAILALARELDLVVIAEGIETRAQHECLLDEGCLRGQGYLYGMPMSVAQVEGVLLGTEARRPVELIA